MAVYAGVLPRVTEPLCAPALLTDFFVLPTLVGHDLRAAHEVSGSAIPLPAEATIGCGITTQPTALVRASRNKPGIS